ncbi:hypothetical protein BZG17_30645 [Escherichia coli]|nr:hypothetical protein [Escherichia coli]
MPPMEFEQLVDELIPANTSLYIEIAELLRRKKSGDELDLEPQLPAIHSFLKERIAWYEQRAAAMARETVVDVAELDRIFRAALDEVWAASE